jgi:hypothetical protein
MGKIIASSFREIYELSDHSLKKIAERLNRVIVHTILQDVDGRVYDVSESEVRNTFNDELVKSGDYRLFLWDGRLCYGGVRGDRGPFGISGEKEFKIYDFETDELMLEVNLVDRHGTGSPKRVIGLNKDELLLQILDYSFVRIKRNGEELPERMALGGVTGLKNHRGKIYYSTQEGDVFLRGKDNDTLKYRFDPSHFDVKIKGRMWLNGFSLSDDSVFIAMNKCTMSSEEEGIARLLRYDMGKGRGECLTEDLDYISAFTLIE